MNWNAIGQTSNGILSFLGDMLQHLYHVWQISLCSFVGFVSNHPTSNGWGAARQLASAEEAY